MVDLRPDHLAIVRAILKAELPDTEVWAFGSRATWTARDSSDLDLAVVGDNPLPLRTLTRLSRALDSSYLPFSVDVVDWSRLPENFRSVILAQKVVLQEGRGTPSGESQWQARPLADCANFLSGGTPSRANLDYWGGDIPWVTAKDMKQFRLYDTQDHVTSQAIGQGTRLVPAGTVLLLVRGMTLHTDLPICITRRPMAFNQDVRALRPRPDIDAEYLAYSLLANKPGLLSLVDAASHGTGRIHSGSLASFPIAVPSLLEEQRAIARVLATLDNKIELNHRTSQTLAAIAGAIFDYWLVNSERVSCESHWGTLEELVSLHRDTLDPSSYPHEEFDHYSIPSFDRGSAPVREEGRKIRSLKLIVPEGATLLSKLNPHRPRVWRPNLSKDRRAVSSTEFVVMTPAQSEFDREYIYSLLCSQAFLDVFSQRTTGTSGSHQRVRSDDFLTIKCLIPKPEIRRQYSEVTRPIFDKISLNLDQAAVLTETRDALLPMLVLGEIARTRNNAREIILG